MSETCLSFLRYLEFLRKKTSFYEKQYSAMIRFYLNANEKGKFLRNFIESYLCNNQDINCEHIALVYIL